MQPQATAAAIVARKSQRHIFLLPPAGHGLGLFRRYAYAALGAARARQFLRETATDAGAHPAGSPD